MSVQERVRYHEYMRPRYSNPTYASSNVGSSIGMIFNPSSDFKTSNLLLDRRSSMPKLDMSQNKMVSQQLKPRENRGLSRLSSYGTSSLKALHKGQLPRGFNEQDIYEKQAKKYNIISMHPISHQQTIKKYPKYHLEDSDSNYYKKLELENQYNKLYNPHGNNGAPKKQFISTNPEISGQVENINEAIRADKSGK